MSKTKTILYREYYPLHKAAELAGVEAEDLLVQASTGDITIYLHNDEFSEPEKIYEFDPSLDEGTKPSYRGPKPPEMPVSLKNETSEHYEERLNQWMQTKDTQDTVIGHKIFYGKNGNNGGFYRVMQGRGYIPLSRHCIEDHCAGKKKVRIELDVNRALEIEDKNERFCTTEPNIRMKKALSKGLLKINQSDLFRLMAGEALLPEDSEAKSSISKPSLLKMVIGMADKHYRYNPNGNDSAVSNIMKTLHDGGINLTDDTIRRALKEAEVYLSVKKRKPIVKSNR